MPDIPSSGVEFDSQLMFSKHTGRDSWNVSYVNAKRKLMTIIGWCYDRRQIVNGLRSSQAADVSLPERNGR